MSFGICIKHARLGRTDGFDQHSIYSWALSCRVEIVGSNPSTQSISVTLINYGITLESISIIVGQIQQQFL